jgi:uncharacterized membrane protein YedE/YeeE
VTVDQTRPALTLRSVHLTGYTLYLLAGTLFGIIAYKSEIISWYRIQEMFRFDSFHMYGVIASAVLVAAVSVWLLKRLRPNSFTGEPISFAPKARTYPRYVLGGTLFGIGWALTGACPGPVFALIGSGFSAFLIVLASAILGTWTYGQLRAKLPH